MALEFGIDKSSQEPLNFYSCGPTWWVTNWSTEIARQHREYFFANATEDLTEFDYLLLLSMQNPVKLFPVPNSGGTDLDAVASAILEFLDSKRSSR